MTVTIRIGEFLNRLCLCLQAWIFLCIAIQIENFFTGDSLRSSIVSFAVLLYILYLVFIHGDMENKRLEKGREDKTWMFWMEDEELLWSCCL